MAKITIQSRLKAAPELAALLEVQGASLAAGLDRRLARFGVLREETPGLVGVLDRLRRGVLEARQELALREEEVQSHILASRRARDRRDRSAVELRRLLVLLRGIIWKTSFDPNAVEKILWLTEKTSRDPVVLLTQTRRAMDGFEKAIATQEVHGPQWMEGVHFDTQDWFETLERKAAELEQALAEVAHARAREIGAVLVRRRAAKAFDELFAPASRWVAALGALAGAPAGAFQVSAATKRSRRRRPPAPAASFNPLQLRLLSSNES